MIICFSIHKELIQKEQITDKQYHLIEQRTFDKDKNISSGNECSAERIGLGIIIFSFYITYKLIESIDRDHSIKTERITDVTVLSEALSEITNAYIIFNGDNEKIRLAGGKAVIDINRLISLKLSEYTLYENDK